MVTRLGLVLGGLVVALSIGCNSAAPPQQGNPASTSPAVQKGQEAAKKEAAGEELTADEESATMLPAGNKGGARRPTPEGTPKQ